MESSSNNNIRELFRSNKPQIVADDIFGDCVSQVGSDDVLELTKCVTQGLQTDELARNLDLQNFLFVIAGALVFMLQIGFAMVCAGNVRVKNVQNTMLKNLLDACGSAIAFWLVGFAFAFGGQDKSGGKGFIGTENFFNIGDSPAYWFFQYTLSSTAVTIVAGTLAERCQMAAYLLYSIVVAGLIYPVVAHSIWSNNGFLSPTTDNPFLDVGVLDFGGGSVVHVTGGVVALIASSILGPRNGRFYDERGEPLDRPKPFPGHSIALQLLGTMILWFGWLGYNPGSALVLDVTDVGVVASKAAVNTALCGAMGGITALFTKLWLEERRTGEPSFDLRACMNGSLSGLVASTAGCALMESWGAVVTGSIAGLIYLWASQLLLRFRIDDAVDAIPVHLFNGIWGMIATGLMATPDLIEAAYVRNRRPGLFYTFGRSNGGVDGTLLLNQVLAVLFVLSWCCATMFPFFIWLNYMNWFRAEALEEMIGLDVSYHGTSIEQETGNGGVKKEYFEAFKRNKEKKLRQRGRRSNAGQGTQKSGSSDSARRDVRPGSVMESYFSEYDPDVNPDAAAVEAMDEA